MVFPRRWIAWSSRQFFWCSRHSGTRRFRTTVSDSVRHRSAQDAVARAQSYLEEGYTWVVDMDLEKFFDRVNHDVLMSRVARRVKDKRLLKLIRAFLNSGVMEDGLFSGTSRRNSAGRSSFAALLSNLLLDELDRELTSRGLRFSSVRGRLQHLRQKPTGWRASAAERDELVGPTKLRLKVNHSEECRGPSVEPQVPGVHVHDATQA